MDLQRQTTSGRHTEAASVIGSTPMGLLGRVSSARGIQILAFDGMPNYRNENQITTELRSLTFLPRISLDSTISVGRRPSRPMMPLNFFAPGVFMETRQSGPTLGALCS